uniref:Uncharacterized protein n=1 Tax=Myripristis murdjan TaxID=586833 RepID=A0A668ARM8_9TELE
KTRTPERPGSFLKKPYIVRMLKWTDRQRILKAARAKPGLKWHGKPFHVFQDLPAEIQQQRMGLPIIRVISWNVNGISNKVKRYK